MVRNAGFQEPRLLASTKEEGCLIEWLSPFLRSISKSLIRAPPDITCLAQHS